LRKAAAEQKIAISISTDTTIEKKGALSVIFIADSLQVLGAVRTEQLKMPASFGWQSYSIQVKNKDNQKMVYVSSGNATGAMYGALEGFSMDH
jgi:hypothetical protein